MWKWILSSFDQIGVHQLRGEGIEFFFRSFRLNQEYAIIYLYNIRKKLNFVAPQILLEMFCISGNLEQLISIYILQNVVFYSKLLYYNLFIR